MKELQSPRRAVLLHLKSSALTSEVHRDSGEFGDLREEWGELYEHCPSATPFQSWEWLYTWWEHYGGDYELRLITLREPERGALVGLLPLMLDPRLPRLGAGRLMLIGNSAYSAPYSSYLDVLVREGWEEEVSRSGARALKELDGWAVADLQELRPEAAAWGLIDSWNGPSARLWHGYCTWIQAGSWDETLSRVSRGTRSDARRALRRVEEKGLRWVHHAEPGEAAAAASRLVALNREQWARRWEDTGPEHWAPRFERHLCLAANRLAEREIGIVGELRLGDEAVLSTLMFFGRDFVGLYIVGAGESARKRSYSALFMRDMIDLAHERGVPYVNLFGGEDAYKLRWNPQRVQNQRVVLGRKRAAFLPYAGYLGLRSRLVRYAKSGEAPPWVSELPARYRRLRYKGARFLKAENTPRWLRRMAGQWFKGV